MTYESVLTSFGAFHQSTDNVWVHVFCCLFGLVGVGALVQRSLLLALKPKKEGALRAFCFALWGLYIAGLAASGVPLDTLARCLCVCVFAAGLTAHLDAGLLTGAVLVALAYFGQDLSHYYYKEETYQQNSWGGKSISSEVVSLFAEHVFWLLPLTLDCASPNARTLAVFLPVALLCWMNYAIDSDSKFGTPLAFLKKRVLTGRFADFELADVAKCRAWMVEQGPKEKTTSHWWISDLDAPTKAAYARLADSPTMKGVFGAKFDPSKYTMEMVEGMNELYVSAPTRQDGPKNSDDVFFTEHVDGPCCFFPGASLYRCIVGLDENLPEFTTHFPVAHVDISCKTAQFVGFDFHRESHYITLPATQPSALSEAQQKDSDKKWRMVLKLHYVVAPKGSFWMLGNLLRWLSVKYNQSFRALFLKTIAPSSAMDKALADFGVNGVTVLYNATEKYFGYSNFLAMAALAAFSASIRCYAVFFYATQFLHYCRYITTYYEREQAAYGAFKRDVLAYKTVALAQLIPLYIAALWAGGLGPSGLISTQLVICGYFTSIAATKALGVDGTYFGIELGVIKADYKFVKEFPYNTIPHPMILGQIGALLGMHIKLHATLPYVVPIHVALYLTHMAQEAFDFHKGQPWYKKQD